MKRYLSLGFLLLLLCGLLCACSGGTAPAPQAEPTAAPVLPSASAAEDHAAVWEAVLYFRYEDSSMLAAESRSLSVRRDESSEAVLIRALLDGPSAGQHSLRRVLGEDVTLKDVSSSGNMLFLTLSSSFLKDAVPDAWASDAFWAQEAPVLRRLCLYSLVNTITENLPFTRVQILIDGGEGAAIRLDRSYWLTGEQGPADPLRREESLLLTPHNTGLAILQAWQARDFQALYSFVESENLPVADRFMAEMDAAPALASYELSAGAVREDGSAATLTLNASLLGDASDQLEAYPLSLVRVNGVWKISLDGLRRLMLR